MYRSPAKILSLLSMIALGFCLGGASCNPLWAHSERGMHTVDHHFHPTFMHLEFSTPESYENWRHNQSVQKEDLTLFLSFSFAPTPENLKDLAPFAERIQSLRFTRKASGTITDDHMQVIGSVLPSLRRLSLLKAPITDHGIELIAGLTSLEKLDMSGAPITNYGIRLVGRQFPNLRMLGVSWTKVDGQAFSGLMKLENLRELKAVGIPIEIFHIGHMTGLKSLKKLHLHRKDVQRYKRDIRKLNGDLKIIPYAATKHRNVKVASTQTKESQRARPRI